MATSTHSSHTSNAHSSNVVGVHYRVGKKIGEGSFGVIFEGTNLLNNQQVAIKFVRPLSHPFRSTILFEVVLLTWAWGVGTEKERCTTVTRRVPDVQDTGGMLYLPPARQSLAWSLRW